MQSSLIEKGDRIKNSQVDASLHISIDVRL